MSAVLRDWGYWPSFNVPFFEDIWRESGYPEQQTWAAAPRQKIFKRDQGKVRDLPSLQRLMQANDYLHDPLSHGDPMAAISSRGDLVARDPQLFGGIDTKAVAAYSAFGRVVAISGPTHETLPPFSWAAWPNTTHDGIPEVWDFSWVTFRG